MEPALWILGRTGLGHHRCPQLEPAAAVLLESVTLTGGVHLRHLLLAVVRLEEGLLPDLASGGGALQGEPGRGRLRHLQRSPWTAHAAADLRPVLPLADGHGR